MSSHPEAAVNNPQVTLEPDLAERSRLQNVLDYCGDLGRNALRGIVTSRMMRSALALGLAAGAGTAVGVASEMAEPNPRAAVADTGGYPDWNKPCVAGDPMDPNSSYGKPSAQLPAIVMEPGAVRRGSLNGSEPSEREILSQANPNTLEAKKRLQLQGGFLHNPRDM